MFSLRYSVPYISMEYREVSLPLPHPTQWSKRAMTTGILEQQDKVR